MEEEDESMEEYEKYLQEAKFMMKNNKNLNKDNNNFIGINNMNNINNINIGSSIATAGFNNGITSLNNLSNSKEDNKLIYYSNNDLQSQEIPGELFNQISSPKNNNIKGSLISMKDNFLTKSSSQNIYDSNNNNSNNIKELKAEISKIKFQLEINHQKYINYEKTIAQLKKLEIESDLRYKKLYSDCIKKEKDLNEKYNDMESKINDANRDKDIQYDKNISILKTKFENLKENNYNLRIKLDKIKEENNELEQINDMRENEFMEELIFKDNEINELQDKINNLRQNYALIEEENENIIRQLNKEINEENSILNNNIINLKVSENKKMEQKNRLYKHKRSISSIYEKKYNIEDNDDEVIDNLGDNENGSIFSKSINTYDLYKIRELKEKIKLLEKEIFDLNIQLYEKNNKNDALASKVIKLRNILEKDEIDENNENKYHFINDKNDNKTMADLQLIINEYENNLNELKQTYNLKIKEQNNEIINLTSNYEQKIKDLLKQIEKIKQ